MLINLIKILLGYVKYVHLCCILDMGLECQQLRLKNLKLHPLQRHLNEEHVTNLLSKDWGESLATIITTSEKYAIQVLVESHDPLVDITPDLLIQLNAAPERQASFQWLVFSGQHRIEVLKRRIELENPGMEDILEHDRAEWYAKVYKSGMIVCFGKRQHVPTFVLFC